MKKNAYLIQVQDSIIFEDSVQYWLPYAIGKLIAESKSIPEINDNFNFDLFFKREDPQNIIDKIVNPTVVAFSSYVWNENYQKHVAKLVKSKWPDCIVIFGGPSATKDYINFDFCDVVVDGEGEHQFPKLLIDILNNHELQEYYTPERIHDLSKFVSPYTSGVFDQIVKDNPNTKWQATFETDRGCPYQCTFCDWGGFIASKIRKYDLQCVFDDIDWLAQNNVEYLFCANANFGIFPERDLLIAKHIRKAANNPKSQLGVVNCQFLKNNTEIAMMVQYILGDLARGVTLSKQSNDDNVLDAIKRKNINNEKYKAQIELGKKYGVTTYTEFILPLPLETKESFMEGLCLALEYGQHNSIDVWPTGILPKSEMGDTCYQKKYDFKTTQVDHMMNNIDYYSPETVEKSTIVVSTNTMSLEDTRDCYFFSWLLNIMHFDGHCNIISRYLNGKHNIKYLDYYAKFAKNLEKNSIMTEIVDITKSHIEYYLNMRNEVIDSDLMDIYGQKGAHYFSSFGRSFCLSKFDPLHDIAVETANEFVQLPDEIIKLQKVYFYDSSVTYPLEIISDYDIINEVEGETHYIVENESQYDMRKISDLVGHSLRRKKGIKSTITVLTDDTENFDIDKRIEEVLQKHQETVEKKKQIIVKQM